MIEHGDSPYRGLRVIFGARDVVESLEDALERAKSGELQGVVIVGIIEEGSGWTGAYVDETPYPWARLQAAVDAAQHQLIEDGVGHWR